MLQKLTNIGLPDHRTRFAFWIFALLDITEHLIRSACRSAEGIFNTYLAFGVADRNRYRVEMRPQSVDTEADEAEVLHAVAE